MRWIDLKRQLDSGHKVILFNAGKGPKGKNLNFFKGKVKW